MVAPLSHGSFVTFTEKDAEVPLTDKVALYDSNIRPQQLNCRGICTMARLAPKTSRQCRLGPDRSF